MKKVVIKRQNKIIFNDVKYCDDFLSNLKGLMFSQKIKQNQGLLLVAQKQSKLYSAIHMIFVFFSIYAIFLDKEYKIVDIKKACPFNPLIIPDKPAKYVLETISKKDLKIGDKLLIETFLKDTR